MLGPTSEQLAAFYQNSVLARKAKISARIRTVCPVVQEILKEVETQEPRFISTLNENAGSYEGFLVHGPASFEVILYLNQMGVFNFVDDGSNPGSALLKLSDGRKRSMSLWVEFITASGYLSAKKIRAKFLSLVAAVLEKPKFSRKAELRPEDSEVILKIEGKYSVKITPAFRCAGIWPRSAAQWPAGSSRLGSQAADVKSEGFDLLARERTDMVVVGKSVVSSEGDEWFMHFGQAEDRILSQPGPKMTLSLLKTLSDAYFLDQRDNLVTNFVLKSLILHEMDKNSLWDETSLGDRLISVLLQLVHFLKCGRFPHYFVANLDLFAGFPVKLTHASAKAAWNLFRDMVLNPKAIHALST